MGNSPAEILLKHGACARATELVVDVALLESQVAFPLPAGYLQFLSSFTSFDGAVGPQCFYLWDGAELIANMSRGDAVAHAPGLLAIGGNGGGESIELEQTPQGCRVVLVPLVSSDPSDRRVIGNSFTDFLQRLDAGRPWFEEP